jgi:mannan polymerase II complex ANP1 subunit
MEIDGVGGVSILAKARVFRSGVHFPAFSFEKHAETEAFGKMAKRMKFSVVGLPHYTVWHLYEPSVEDIRHMEEMENEKRAREQEEQAKKEAEKKMKESFLDVGKEWDKDWLAIKAEKEQEKLAADEAKKVAPDEKAVSRVTEVTEKAEKVEEAEKTEKTEAEKTEKTEEAEKTEKTEEAEKTEAEKVADEKTAAAG